MTAPTSDKPAIDYTDKDYESLRQALLGLATFRLPEWTDRSAADVGMLLVDLFAYMGDVVSYYQDRIASESFLDTAVERRSILNLLRLIGYELAPPAAASAELTLVFNPPGPGEPTTVTVPSGAAFATTAGTTPAQTFVYLGDARTIDLAGPEVKADADGKLSFAGPAGQARPAGRQRDPRLADGRAEPGIPARVEPGRARHPRGAGRRGRRPGDVEPAHEPPVPRRRGRAHRHLGRERHRLLRPVRRGQPRVGRLRRRRVRPQASGRAGLGARLLRHRRRGGGQRRRRGDRRGDDEDRPARARHQSRSRPPAERTPSRSTAPSASGRSRSGRATAP